MYQGGINSFWFNGENTVNGEKDDSDYWKSGVLTPRNPREDKDPTSAELDHNFLDTNLNPAV